MLLVHWCLTNSAKKPGEKLTGLFTYKDDMPAAPAKEADGNKRGGLVSGRWNGLP